MNFKYEIIKSARKSIGIVVSPNCIVTVRVPKRIKDSEIQKVLQEKSAWIEKRILFFTPFLQKKLEDKISFLGEDFNLIFQNETLKKNVLIDGNNIIVSGSNPKLQFEKWLSLRASEIFLSRLEKCFEKFLEHFSYKKPSLKIRKMRSRWGSLSSSGVMTLNLMLIHTPIDCIDYVIMHELCHLKYKNHGKNFHKLEAFFVPNFKELNYKLKGFGVWLKS